MTKQTFFTNIIFIFLMFVFLESCAVHHGPVYEKNGKTYGVVDGNFTGQWYDFYERGLSYSDGLYFNEALSDINTAIEIKPEDKRWINTYGMHFIDYFPHREKGIILYHLKEYELSEKELLMSMTQAPSEKAKFFLEKVRKELLLIERKESTNPEISITCPRSSKDSIIEIKGIVDDPCFISEVRINGKKMIIETSDKKYVFTKQLALPEGSQAVRISARNLLGGETEKTIPVVIDRSGPSILLEKYTPGVEISGYVYDASDIRSFRINNKDCLSDINNGYFRILPEPQMENYILTASDSLGNKTELLIEEKPSSKQTGMLIGKEGIRVAANDAWASDFLYQKYECSPSIKIELCDLKKEIVVYRESINLTGSIRTSSPVTDFRMKLNGVDIENDVTEIIVSGRVSGNHISFNKSVPLERGVNVIDVVVADETGGVSQKKIRIIRHLPEIMKLENRFALKIYPPDKHLNADTEKTFWGRFFSDSPVFNGYSGFLDKDRCDVFEHAVVNDFLKRKRFRLLSLQRNKAAAPDAVIFSNTCVDRNGVEIAARMVKLSNFEEIMAKDVFHSDDDETSILHMASDLSKKFHEALPVVTGSLKEIAGHRFRVIFDRGMIEDGWPVLVYKNQEINGMEESCLSAGEDIKVIGRFNMGKNKTVDVGNLHSVLCKGDRVINK